MSMRERARTPAGKRRELAYRPVPLDSIAPVMQEAVVIGEDNNFWSHGGIDYLAIAQALGYTRPTFSWSDRRDREELRRVLPNAWKRRDKLRGASTITQQVAKNLYLSPSRNPLRKVKEAVTAWRLELVLDKRRIMALYLNIVELGDGVWGVEAASQRYFHKSARRLTREEAAALAGALPFPLRSNPGYRPARMRWRQDLILRRMGGEWVEVPPVDRDEPSEGDSIPAVPPQPEFLIPDSVAAMESDSLTLESPAPDAETAQDSARDSVSP
jgi:monofunctional biosynthetic peptidoglycan transglycosylase